MDFCAYSKTAFPYVQMQNYAYNNLKYLRKYLSIDKIKSGAIILFPAIYMALRLQ